VYTVRSESITSVNSKAVPKDCSAARLLPLALITKVNLILMKIYLELLIVLLFRRRFFLQDLKGGSFLCRGRRRRRKLLCQHERKNCKKTHWKKIVGKVKTILDCSFRIFED